MTEALTPFTRRQLIRTGLAGTAAAGLGTLGVESVASAADDVLPHLRRSTYESLTATTFHAGPNVLELVAVEDLPVAETLPALRDRDDAFSLRFRGSAAPGDAPLEMRHPEIGTFALFLAPVGTGQDLEAVIDRTVRTAGLDAAGAPQPVSPGPERSGAVAGAAAAGDPASASTTRPGARLRGSALRRSPSGRRVSASLAFASSPRVRTVRAVLVRAGRPVARSTGRVGDDRVRLAFTPRRRARAGRYELRLVVVDRRGRLTRLTVPLTLT